ncbi:hypothetical protein Q8F55_008310 [Vanrija albida]|uniref:Uncharacterized protein n=1 Tax=Vanrija albida TaxID=181172 RepID=A0ABR3PVV3_9TREE
MIRAPEVWSALDSYRGVNDASYRLQVIRTYLTHKVHRQRSKLELQLKLIPLERQYPNFADTFQTARLEFGLPVSPVVGAPAERITRAYQMARAAARAENRRLPFILDTASVVSLLESTQRAPRREPTPPPPAYEREDTEATIRDLETRLGDALDEAQRARARLAEAEEARRVLEERVRILEAAGLGARVGPDPGIATGIAI